MVGQGVAVVVSGCACPTLIPEPGVSERVGVLVMGGQG